MVARIMAALALLVSAVPAALAQQPQAPLSDVNVTAQAPIQHVNPFNPFSGDTRVDEARWPVIPCNTARVDLGAGARCQTGTPVETFLTMSTGGRCDIARQVTMAKNAHYEAEADVMIMDPYKVTAAGHQGKNCTVWTGYVNMPDDFRDMNQMTRRGTNFRNLVSSGDDKSIEFNVSNRYCKAIRQSGPRWHGGYIYIANISICRNDTTQVQAEDIATVFAALRIRIYDKDGNLRAAE
jgi:hypothetical protein